MTHLRNPMFHDEEKAREWFEARVLAEWPVLSALRRNPNSDPLAWQGRREGNQGAPRPHPMHPGLIQCNGCREQFTVSVNTVCERSKLPSPNGGSRSTWSIRARRACQLYRCMHRMMGGSYKAAWFLFHRVREAMREGKISGGLGANKVVEIDEIYVGGKAANRKNHIPPKAAVLSLVERDGKVRCSASRM